MQKTWDEYYLEMAALVASRSEDESTKCGSVIVGLSNQVISTGYNGFPRGVTNLPERNERPIKYKYFEHAERNAIYNAARSGVSTLGSVIYMTGYPCCDCARAIIQAGITAIILPGARKNAEFVARWKDNLEVAIPMLREAGVKIIDKEVEGISYHSSKRPVNV
jgi:dCMP deaminase